MDYDGKASPAKSRWLAFDGLLRAAPNGDKTKLEAALDDEDILTGLAKMGNRGILGRDLPNCVCVVPPEVSYKMDAFESYEGMDKVGPLATLLRGQVAQWRGVPVVVSEDIPLTAAADGNVDNDSSNNVLGSIFFFNRSGIKVGLRRRPKLEQERVPGVDGTFIAASLRMDVNQLEDGYVSYLYNVPI